MASLHSHQISQVLAHEANVPVCWQDLQVQLLEHQPLMEETEEGLNDKSQTGGTLMHSSTKDDRFGQGPFEFDQKLQRHIAPGGTLENRTLKLTTWTVPTIHPIKCLLLVKGQKGE